MEGEHFDLIIANPPYGKIGANITKKIIDTIDFGEYVNLLPANDYKRNDTHDLYKYVDIDSMKPVSRGFKDAAVTTHMARITKKPHTYISWDEFQIENYIDDSLKKYFYENLKRSHYAIDKMPGCGFGKKSAGNWDISRTFIIALRDMNHRHLPYTKDCVTYKWNVEKVGTMSNLPITCVGQYLVSNCEFTTAEEKENFVEFIYSNVGFRFMCKVFTALNCDGTVHSEAFPKVDWTREWTVEEILADYGYTEKEIKEVMDDLVNFKGMD